MEKATFTLCSQDGVGSGLLRAQTPLLGNGDVVLPAPSLAHGPCSFPLGRWEVGGDGRRGHGE